MGGEANVFKYLKSDNKKPTLDDYFEKFKVSFRRIWENRFLWFWGMFLPGSVGIGFNIEEKLVKLKPVQITNWQEFIKENLGALTFLLAIVLLFWFFVWFFSAISRSGVIQALLCLQNPKNKKKINCKMIWKMGKKDLKKLLLLDFFIGMSILIVFLVLLIPVAIMILTGNQGGAIFLFMVLLVLFFLFMVFANYLLQISTVYIVLIDLEVYNAIEIASRLIINNIAETIKLFSVFFLISILQGTIFLLLITAIMPFWGEITNFWFTLYENSFSEWLMFSSALAILLSIVFLFTKAIFSLWIQDVWLWWVQETGGNKIPMVEGKVYDEAVLLKSEVALGIEGLASSKQ